MSDLSEVRAAHGQILAAAEAMRRALEKAFPDGSEVLVRLRENQALLTHGVVVAVWGDGTVRVRLTETRRKSVKSVHYTNVVIR